MGIIKNPWDERMSDAMLAVLSATSEYVDVTKSEQLINGVPGTGQKGVCPYCGRPNKFSVNLQRGMARCAACGKGSDPVAFFKEYFNTSYKKAKEYISGALGYTEGVDAPMAVKTNLNTLPPSEEAEIQSEEDRDKNYSIILKTLKLMDREKSMLLARGLSSEEISRLGYKTLPGYDEFTDRDMEAILNLCKDRKGAEYEGLPGLYTGNFGKTTMARPKGTGIAMPQRNRHNQITGIQVRIDNQFLVDGENKCRWLSSQGRKDGCKAQTGVHYACDWKDGVPVHDGDVWLTEGIMKADIAHALLPQKMFISIPGVNIQKPLEEEMDFLKSIGVKSVTMCFDQDYLTNPNVQDALKSAVGKMEAKGMTVKPQRQWSIESPGKKLKGIDDYLAYVMRGIA